jgi:nitroreductase
MELEQAIRSRRTHKVFGPEPVAPAVIEELLELARWAPNHNLTNPWRFRVLGPATLARLKELAEERSPGSGGKLDRAPTLIVASVLLSGDEAQRADDLLAGAVASYLVLLAAHGRGLASYWRSVPLLDSPAGREALGLEAGEQPIGLLHLGYPRQEQRVPGRAPVPEFVSYLS